MKYAGQVAVVTGSGRGIGRAVALSLAAEGCAVVVTSRTRKEIEAVGKEISRMGGESLVVPADVRKARDVQRLFKKTMQRFGRIDILVNNAGIASRKPLAETTEQEWDAVLDTNLKGTYLCCREAVPLMKKGVIINVSSGAGKSGFANLAAYCASKFGVIGLTESLAAELKNINVYAVCPGGVDTRMYRALFGSRPFLKPEDIARKVLELCMPGTNARSGSSIEVYF